MSDRDAKTKPFMRMKKALKRKRSFQHPKSCVGKKGLGEGGRKKGLFIISKNHHLTVMCPWNIENEWVWGWREKKKGSFGVKLYIA